MTENFKEVLSPDYYAIISDPNSGVIVNDIRFTRSILLVIDSKYNAFQTELKKAIVKEQAYNGLNKDIGDELYSKLIESAELQKEKLKKDIIVSGHLANISNKTTVRTATIFYNNLKSTVAQQLELAFSLIISRLKSFYLRDINNAPS